MSDLIRVVDLEVEAHIGVSHEERARAQRLLVSLEMGVESFRAAAAADDVALAVNYFDVTQRMKRLIAGRRYKLLETLVEEIATDLLKTFPIKTVTVEIKKFILPDARWVSVQITRKKE
jgi:dihydroneopterin aldolase